MFRGVDGAVPRVMLASYESAKRNLKETGWIQEGIGLHFTASMLSGLVVTTCMNPFDVVSTRLYNQAPSTPPPLFA
ncbi:hypothetical protein T484DRAFT_1825278 [Baffinella frigidus]|nr:hypothetical protein T484DRAFT_1825278 [Cryptophyta sp. CCMP2293]